MQRLVSKSGDSSTFSALYAVDLAQFRQVSASPKLIDPY